MKKGTKVYFYKTTGGSSVINHAEEGTVVGVKDEEVVIQAPRQVSKGVTREAIQYKKPYELFTSKEDLFDAIVNGVRVWTTNRDTLEITEGRFDIVNQRCVLLGTKEMFRGTRTSSWVGVFATIEEALNYLDTYLTENVANRLHRVRECEKNLKAAMNDHKERQALLSRVRDRIQGKNRLMSFRPKKSSTTKRRPRDDDED